MRGCRKRRGRRDRWPTAGVPDARNPPQRRRANAARGPECDAYARSNGNRAGSRRLPQTKTMIARVMYRFVLALVLTLLFAAFEAAAAPEGAGLVWSAPGEVPRAAASLSLDVQYDVRGLVADARVVQRFRNDTPSHLEGRYRLPLPEGAAVHTLTLRVGGRVIEGVIREKRQAQAEYAAAAANGQRASL